MEIAHIDEILPIHLQELAEDFNTRLGTYYLKNIFFKESVISDIGFGYVFLINGKVAGYITGTLDSSRFFNRELILKHLLEWMYILTSRVVMRPSMLKEMILGYLEMRKFKAMPYKAHLTYIAIDAKYQGRKIGRDLVEAFVDHVRRLGMDGCFTGTNKDWPAANKLYQSAGFTPYGEITLPHSTQITYVKKLKEDTAPIPAGAGRPA